jgi:DNA-binding NarL/FixJ family response regulator
MALRIVRSKFPPKRSKRAGRSRTTRKGGLIAVYVAEQNYLAAQYLLRILAEDGTLAPFSLEELVVNTTAARPAPIFVVDRGGINLPLGECLHVLKERYAEARFVVLDEERSQEEIVQLLALGIHGLVSYRRVSEQLTQAVHWVVQDRMWISADVLEAYVRFSVASRKRVGTSPTGRGITPRESQVMELAKRRLSNKEIGEILNIQESTVKFHLSNIFSKLEVNRRSQLRDPGQSNEIWRKLMAS